MVRLALIVALALLPALASPARADVDVTFWSHRSDQNFPHAFLVLDGILDATGEVIDTSIGFTPRNAPPTILVTKVHGKMEALDAEYMTRPTTRPSFTVRLQDAEFIRLVLAIDRWRAMTQPNYDLRRHNCVHFVMDAALAMGLRVNRRSPFFSAPRLFLKELMRLNHLVAVSDD